MDESPTNPMTRRHALYVGVGASFVTVAGCIGNGQSPFSDESSKNSVFQDVSYEGGDMVVSLKKNHSVTKINLISPDGSVFAESNVPEGASSVHLPILDIEAGGNYRHYSPGTHELVAVIEAGNRSMKLDLLPKLKIVNVSQYRSEDHAENLGKLAVDIENRGTAPTWVYQIVYENAPNSSANDELGDDPGAPILDKPDKEDELIIGPQASQTFVGSSAPLLFTGDSPTCDKPDVDFSVVVGTAVTEPIKTRIKASFGGEPTSVGLTGEYTCSNVSIQQISDGESDD